MTLTMTKTIQFEILSERTQTPELTIINGIYNNKPFAMYYYEFHNTGTVKGDFTTEEIQEIYYSWLCGIDADSL